MDKSYLFQAAEAGLVSAAVDAGIRIANGALVSSSELIGVGIIAATTVTVVKAVRSKRQ